MAVAQLLYDTTGNVYTRENKDISPPKHLPFYTPDIQLYPIDSSFLNDLQYSYVRAKVNEAIRMLNTDKTLEYINERDILNERISNYYRQHEGKVIQNIFVRRLDFNIDFSDTSRRIDYFGTKILSALHTTTREYLIRDNLFINKGEPLNPFLIADNERYLRTLPFIRDARIVIKADSINTNVVDVYVITKDLFSISAEVREVTGRIQHAMVSENNLFGSGQSLKITGLRDTERNPKVGFNVDYFIPNLFGSLVNADFRIGNITNNLYDRRKNTLDIRLSVQKPLVSQYTSFIGALTIGKQKTFNNFSSIYNDTTQNRYQFIAYDQNYIDATVGYNIKAKKYILDNKTPDRNVIMLRYFNHHFTEYPTEFLYRFSDSLSDRSAVLFQYTYFKQFFYKTNYILGFGTTEDMPAGINVSVTAGYRRSMDIERPYLGVDLNRYFVNKKSDILQYFFRGGTYFAKNVGFEDINLIGGLSMYSRLINMNKIKFRQRILASYAQQINSFTSEPLRINNLFGLTSFREDSIMAEKRLSVRSESFFFLNRKVLGFKFAPFITADASLLDLNKYTIWHDNVYYSIGGGVRTRNENLQFGTIELRFNYFPKKIAGHNQFSIMIRTNLKFRYNANYVTPPKFIEYNSDIYSNVY